MFGRKNKQEGVEKPPDKMVLAVRQRRVLSAVDDVGAQAAFYGVRMKARKLFDSDRLDLRRAILSGAEVPPGVPKPPAEVARREWGGPTALEAALRELATTVTDAQIGNLHLDEAPDARWMIGKMPGLIVAVASKIATLDAGVALLAVDEIPPAKKNDPMTFVEDAPGLTIDVAVDAAGHRTYTTVLYGAWSAEAAAAMSG